MPSTRCTTQRKTCSAGSERPSPARTTGSARLDPFPVRDDLGIYHVPFSELAGDGHIEQTLGDGCRRYERIAIVGDSGTGKSSLTASVLGPLAEGVALVVVPVTIEPNDTVSEPRAMFAHIAAVIARVATTQPRCRRPNVSRR